MNIKHSIIFFLFSGSCLAQKLNLSCDTLVLDRHTQEVLNIHEKNLHDYLKNRKNNIYISNRKKLKILNTFICNDKEVLIYDVLKSKIIEINIEKGIKRFNPSPYLIPGENFQSNLLQIYDNNNAPYGFMANDTIVNYISNLKIKIAGKIISIPKSAYEDLFFPNFCNIELSIKPIQGYFSNSHNKLYIYIFGELRPVENISRQYAFRYSYMAKLIIDIDKGYLARIVMRGDELCYYNWDNCFDFIGF